MQRKVVIFTFNFLPSRHWASVSEGKETARVRLLYLELCLSVSLLFQDRSRRGEKEGVRQKD